MVTKLLEWDGYSVETFMGTGPYLGDERIVPRVRIVRKSDGAWHNAGEEVPEVFHLLWERLHGTPVAETKAWFQEWFEGLAAMYSRDDTGLWEKPTVAA